MHIKIDKIHIRIKGLSQDAVRYGVQNLKDALIKHFQRQSLAAGNGGQRIKTNRIDIGTVSMKNTASRTNWHDVAARHITRQVLSPK